MLSCHVTIIHGCEGPSNCITCGDASGQLALGEAARYIRRNVADAAIAGGAESKLNPMGLLRQPLLGRLVTDRNDQPQTACRPFDAGHNGTAIGEGGALLVLEDADRAKGRQASIYAELAGFGAACDPAGIDVTRANVGNMAMAVRSAMRDAGIGPEQIDLIAAHGTGVPGEDALEAAAWHEALGGRASDVPAFSVTGGLGQTFAGGGAIQTAMAAIAIQRGTIPPTVNHEQAAEGCELNLSSEPRTADLRYAVSASFGVGGQSAAVILKKSDA
jgi:3-oxoacyl-[acyl-carrier-protein] synthase II